MSVTIAAPSQLLTHDASSHYAGQPVLPLPSFGVRADCIGAGAAALVAVAVPTLRSADGTAQLYSPHSSLAGMTGGAGPGWHLQHHPSELLTLSASADDLSQLRPESTAPG